MRHLKYTVSIVLAVLAIILFVGSRYSENHYDFILEVQKNRVHGTTFMYALGQRENIGTTATGEDLWMGTATSIPEPADAGEQMEIVSLSANDSLNGSGVHSVRVHYLDANGDQQTEDVTLDGTTGVALTETNVRFVNDIHAISVGSNGVAAGNITIYKQGASSTIYNMITLGGNKSLVPNRMVPRNHTLFLRGWQATEAQGKRAAFRIRSTNEGSTLLDGIFLFKGSLYLSQSASGEILLNEEVPALSIVKVSAWAALSGGEGACSWWGFLVKNENL